MRQNVNLEWHFDAVIMAVIKLDLVNKQISGQLNFYPRIKLL